MTRLGEIETSIRARGDLSVFDRTHLHRAWFEDAFGRVRGRDRIRDRATALLAEEGLGPIAIEAESDGFLAWSASAGWRGHRWIVREGERIAGETEVVDGIARAKALGRDVEAEAARIGAAHPLHTALGELRAGRGQLAPSDTPELPDGFGAPVAAAYLNRVWNARALDLLPGVWRGPDEAGGDATGFVLRLLTALPDAVCLFERGLVVGDHEAVLWRLHGHHLGPGFGTPSGKRVRLIGSSLLLIADGLVTAEDMLIDTLALRATAHRPLIDYSA